MTTAGPVDGGRHHGMAANSRHSMPPPADRGSRNGGSGPAGAAGPIPHIDDVIAVPKDIDPREPIKRLLNMAEASLTNSEICRDFGRPSLALQDFIRASIIVVQTIPNHADYLEMKASRRDGAQRHAALLKKISQQSEAYERIKREIIQDNRITGVQPTGRRPSPASAVGNERLSISSSSSSSITATSVPKKQPPINGNSRPQVNGSSGKTKPIVHPKPQSLHGKAIKPGHVRAASTASASQATLDLAARFANLRGPQSSPGQDPRIKTHQIIPPKPAGPREMPPSHRTPRLAVDSSIPTLPKMPDAIYSPARGSISGETTRLPTSASRGLSSRTGSSVSINSTLSISTHQHNNNHSSSQSQTASEASYIGPFSMSDIPITIPAGNGISPKELYDAMRAKGTILIIDIRTREKFDEGHIMSSSTICIEPSILSRDEISADDIAEGLVLSPNQEQILFEGRTSYDLVVIYDQYSTDINYPPRSASDTILASLYRALVDLSYGQELKNPPKVLSGGLDAWIGLMGQASLQINTAPNPRRLLPGHSFTNPLQRRESKYIGKPLKPSDVKAWQAAVENEEKEAETATDQTFHRSTEAFLRRYPTISEQESMVSTLPGQAEQKLEPYGTSHKVDLYTDLPSPPVRPPPALPRPSYSGLSQEVGDDGDDADPAVPAQRTGGRANKPVDQSSSGNSPNIYTGLNNPHNWCYANSTLQSLLASPDFGAEISNAERMKLYKVPKMKDEKMEHPQLMIRILSNLFHWMATRHFKVMKAQTLMDYSRHLCLDNSSEAKFGGSQQQDAQEFMSFLMEHLHDETNTRRDRMGIVPQPDTKGQSLLRAARDYWRSHEEGNMSIVDKYWRGLELSTVECQQCHTKTFTFMPFEWISASVGKRPMTLEQSLNDHISGNILEDFTCDHCKRKTRALQSLSFARMPALLCVCFRRFEYDSSTCNIKKSTATITWDFNNVDFSPYFMNTTPADRNANLVQDRALRGPFRYECYAVVVHDGRSTDTGHYLAYVRDSTSHDPYAWFCCNDSTVTNVRIGSGEPKDIQKEVFKSGSDRVPYLVFFRRKP